VASLHDRNGGWAAAAAAAGVAATGGALFWFLRARVFGPAARWRREVEGSEDGAVPRDAGLLSPLAAAAADRCERIRSRLEARLAECEARLEGAELVRRHFEEARRHLEGKVRELHSIYEVSTAIAGTLDVDELFRIIPGRVQGLLGLREFRLLLYDPAERVLRCRASAGIPEEEATAIVVRPGEGVAGRVFESGQAFFVPGPGGAPGPALAGGPARDARSVMAVPLVSRGRVIGVLDVQHPEPDGLDAESMAMLRALAAHIATAVENAELFGFVKTLAAKDSLTLLFNHGAFHRRFEEELERADRYRRPLSVMMLDLDRFKEINDTFGHLVGDRVLVAAGGVLSAHLRQSDVPARYGGDEFAAILPETDFSAASAIAARIAEGISHVRVETQEGRSVGFTASVGFASCPAEGRERRRLLEVADRLMYESKRKGPGGILGERLG